MYFLSLICLAVSIVYTSHLTSIHNLVADVRGWNMSREVRDLRSSSSIVSGLIIKFRCVAKLLLQMGSPISRFL